MQTIFLHSGWRCGSTYLWSKFRALPGVLAFYEPFSEKLARYTRQRIKADTETAWNSRHPALDAPYASEYSPLVSDIGVPGYEERFALERYFVGADEPLQESGYLKSLLDHASARRRQAVLGFSRSLGRVGAIKREFAGYHVVLMRDPVQQWLSGRSYRVQERMPYFELCNFMILSLAPPGSLAWLAARWLHLPRLPAGSFGSRYRFLRSRYGSIDDELSYKVFVAVYLLSYLEALPESDLIIDMDLLSRSHRYGAGATMTFFQRTGLAPSLDDCCLPRHDYAAVRLDFESIHRSVSEWLLANERHYGSCVSQSMRTSTWSSIINKLSSALAEPPSLHGDKHMPENLDNAVLANLRKSSTVTGARVRRLLGL